MYPQTESGASGGQACPDSADKRAERPRAVLEVIMLLRKLQEPLAAISRETRRAEESLFLRLEELARDRPFLLDCTVQQLADDELVAILSDRDSGTEVCAWSGTPDAVVIEFTGWLDMKYPRRLASVDETRAAGAPSRGSLTGHDIA
jgi:hypothetical protein